MSRWFRFYDEVVNDPKILRLSDANFRAWVTLLCLASKNDGVLPSTNDIALVLRLKPAKVAEWLAMLTAAGLLDNDNGLFRPHNWDARQFKSDVSNERVKRFRQRQRNGECNVTSAVTVTAPETEQKQITEQISSLRSDSARKRGTRLIEGWSPSTEDWNAACERLGQIGARAELEKFRDHWKAAPGQRGVKLDWDATWRNWIRNARGPANGAGSASLRTYPGAQQSGSASVLAGVAAATERRARERAAAGQHGTLPDNSDPAERADAELFGTGAGAAAHR